MVPLLAKFALTASLAALERRREYALLMALGRAAQPSLAHDSARIWHHRVGAVPSAG